ALTSMTDRPVSDSLLTNSTLSCVRRLTCSFCRPSRGPTSTTVTRSTSLAPGGRPLLEEGAQAFLSFRRHATRRDRIRRERGGLVGRASRQFAQELLDGADRFRTGRQDFSNVGVDGGVEVAGVRYGMHQADFLRAGGWKTRAAQEHLARGA